MILKALNTTFISLVPKKDNALTPDKFQPSAFCNVVYKIITKMFANHLQKVLPLLISPCQGSFLPGRLITDNIVLAQE